MIICESGATNADWRVIENGGQVIREISSGINVSTMKIEIIESIIKDVSERLPAVRYDEIHFYTAGVITPSIENALYDLLKKCFTVSQIEIQNDLVASARAACGHAPGIAAIMGTGSNSCQWDGERIVRHVKSGGFIIGDDGSASVLGKLFISDFIKGLVPEEIAFGYSERYPSVYHNQCSPSAWLGSLCPFIMSHYSHPYIKNLVDGNVRAFVDRSLMQYEVEKYPVAIIGGFGNALKDIVRPIFEENGIRIRAFIPSPIEELIRFHMKENLL